MTEEQPKNPKKTEESLSGNAWWQPALIVFAKASVWIAGPVVVALFLGRFLDKKFGTEPWFFIGITAFAFIISLIGMVKEVAVYMKEIEEISKIENNGNRDKNN